MNAKKVKSVRKAMRAQGFDWFGTQYTARRFKDGKAVPQRLTPECNRFQYKRMKETAANQI